MSRFDPPEPIRVDEVLARLPDDPALRPVVDRLIAHSSVDETRSWATSGLLGTTGSRLVDIDALETGLSEVVAAEARRMERRAGVVVAIARAMAERALARAVGLMLDEAGALETEGRADEAFTWAEAAGRLGREIGDTRTAEAIRRAARAARASGRLSEAASAYEEGFTRAVDLGLIRDAVIAATGRGNVAVDRGRWSAAEGWYRRALELLDDDSASLAPDEDAGLRWRLCQNLGITARERGALPEAAAWYDRAEIESRDLRDEAITIEIQNGLGQLDLARGDARRAEVRFRNALEVLRRSRPEADPVRVAITVNLGEALLEQGRDVEAGRVGREAEAEAVRGSFPGRLPEVYRLLARVAAAGGEHDAFVFLDRALHLVRTHGLPRLEEAWTLLAYAELRGKDGEPDLADGARREARQILEALDAETSGPDRDGEAT